MHLNDSFLYSVFLPTFTIPRSALNAIGELMIIQFKNGKPSSSAQSVLSFEQVCPRWAWKIRQGLDEHDVHTLVRDSYCIVGEAWGHSGRHAGYYIAPLIALVGCWTCIKFGREMGKIAKLHGQSCINDLQPVINHFLEHWNNKHRNITKKGICSIDNRQ